ncbi:hypothetical protein H0A61_01548 [Koleobacter methoxysyntrophicus]|uniref:Uncharacterized protein n=1 Tax=Koleobacter methoxysyntrophicus TaxID=2751313 RepID=A0A8A0RNU8_9FIRM|nr:hypothetical protein H0A61_01548 [Koleobacter methoxysyntrophicus]
MCMINVPWYTVMLRAIPEVIGLILLCLAIINENVESKRKRLLNVTIITIFSTFTLKMLPIRFGINTLFLIILDSISVALHKNFKTVSSIKMINHGYYFIF